VVGESSSLAAQHKHIGSSQGSRDAELLFQIITEREERASIGLGTNLPLSEWGTVFPDPRLVAAIVDRVTFNAHIIETGTQSYRLAASTTAARLRPGRGPSRGGVRQGLDLVAEGPPSPGPAGLGGTHSTEYRGVVVALPRPGAAAGGAGRRAAHACAAQSADRRRRAAVSDRRRAPAGGAADRCQRSGAAAQFLRQRYPHRSGLLTLYACRPRIAGAARAGIAAGRGLTAVISGRFRRRWR
jgi:hypothetical protein